MPEKCLRCGKDLEDVPDWRALACPDHGEDWRWRPCGSRSNERLVLDRHIATCAFGIGDERGLGPSTCAACKIPEQAKSAALWDACGPLALEAVKACRGWLEGDAEYHNRCLEPRDALKKCDAVLAAHAAVKEADDAES